MYTYQCRRNGRPKERERNKIDYTASVALPRHMASIPWVPEWLGWLMGAMQEWTDWGMDGLTYGSGNMSWRLFASGSSTIRKEIPARMNYCVIFRSAHCTDLQEQRDGLCNLPLWRWGAPSQKVYAMTVNHIPCPPKEQASKQGAAMQILSSFWLGKHGPHSRSQHNLHLNYVGVMSSDRHFAKQFKSGAEIQRKGFYATEKVTHVPKRPFE